MGQRRTTHERPDGQDGAGHVEREARALEERVEDDADGLAAADDAECVERDDEVHRHGALEVDGDAAEEGEEQRGHDLERHLEHGIRDEERLEGVGPVVVFLREVKHGKLDHLVTRLTL